MWPLLANLIVLLHLAFAAFAVFGGLLVLRWKQAVWLHVPAAGWAVLVELTGWVCPLTPLGQWLRFQGGERPYRSGFIEQYLLPILYPADLTRSLQVAPGLGLLAMNLTIYSPFLYRLRRRSLL
jgi:hypothetical protein